MDNSILELPDDLSYYRDAFALIVAGGRGVRMASPLRKQYLDLAGLPILARTLKQFIDYKGIRAVVVVVPDQDMEFCIEEILKPHGLEDAVLLVAGGSDRQASVRNGLLAIMKLKDNGCLVMIHDGVRPFAEHSMIQRCLEAARRHGAAIPVVPVTDTLVRGDKEGFAVKNVERNALFQVQTPQCFDLDLVFAAHEHALETRFVGTDDASLVEHLGHRVFMTLGSSTNIKITTRDDLLLAHGLVNLERSKA
ncbi:MAG: 2-C-methyl-D-erythritol 4-phosphate cytidylyltransferase [Desulfobacterium sp.]|jgi:2-C-methyl-D-erythritol 4-phosphate cytidylyltransferase|nr:2-C-methyl-D-erythritol 4-phosphate cytidylyltransferase [Desulfobacterium sp.]